MKTQCIFILTMLLKNSLITGGSGMVGSKMDFGLKPTSTEMDITNEQSVKKYTENYPEISCIIHLASVNLRESETYPTKAITVNINGTTNMLKIAQKRNIPFILFSTGAVFSSTNKNDSFDETSKTTPNCVYGYTKDASEKIALLYEKSIIIRTGWLFGGNQKTHYKFVETTINNLYMKTPVMASNNLYGSPTYVVDVIEKMKDILINNPQPYGIHHIVNDGIGTGYDIALEIGNNMNIVDGIIPVSSVNVPNSGPFRGSTEVLVTNNNTNILRSWKEALKEYIRYYIGRDAVLLEPNTRTPTDSPNSYKKKSFLVNKSTKTEEEPSSSCISKIRECCRLCKNMDLYTFFNLEPTPPSNQFVPTPQKQEYIPLDVCICMSCHHIQLLEIVEPAYLYSNYVYVSSVSKTMTDHLKTSVEKFVHRYDTALDANILEIGANDGTCIQHLLDLGYKNVMGIDPAKNIHKRHNLPIICDFFGSNTVDVLKKNGLFSLIYSFHCCAHIENIQDVFESIQVLLEPNGVFVMEVGYFLEIFKNNCFDTIYHEHIDYHTCTAIKKFATTKKMRLFHIETNDIQGGSIQFYFCKDSNIRQEDETVKYAIEKEAQMRLFDVDNLRQWPIKIKKNGKDIGYILNSFISNGKKIAGYGASAKSTTFIHQYKLNRQMIDYIIDENVYKHNMYSPGLHIPIKPLSVLETDNVDYIIILSWNFSNDIIKKLDNFRKNGGRIIIPFPNIQIL